MIYVAFGLTVVIVLVMAYGWNRAKRAHNKRVGRDVDYAMKHERALEIMRRWRNE